MTSNDRIEALETNAAAAGDHAQVLICRIALGEVDPDEGYEHLWIWSFLTAAERRKITQMDRDAALAECERVLA